MSFCPALYRSWDEFNVTKLVPRECPHQAFVLCFAWAEAISV